MLLACGSSPGSSGTSDAPVGLHLTGEFALRRQNGEALLPRPFACDVYFPHGRGPGAPVLLAAPTVYPPGLAVASGVVDEAGGVHGLTVTGHDGQEFSFAAGIAPGGAVTGHLWRNVADGGSDVSDDASASATMTTSEAVPAPTLTPTHATFGPTAILQFVPAVPIDGVSALAVRYSDGQPFAGRAIVTPGSLLVAPGRAFAPTVPLTIDAANVRDVLGRPMSLAAVPTPLTTTAALADGTLTEPLPAGAGVIDGAWWRQADGVLSMGDVTSYGVYGPYSALLSLGDRHGATKLRIRHRVDCGRYAAVASARISVVTSYGVAVDLTPKSCAAEFSETVVDLPGPGLLWLVVVQDDRHGEPQRGFATPTGPYVLDAVTFE